MKVVFVTDPMCSWCWGMATDIDLLMNRLAGSIDFDLVLGGINTDGTQPVGAYGRSRILALWRDVEATTGQPFGDRLPEGYVHNSLPCCVAVEAVRRAVGAPPFAYLRELQARFCLQGQDVTNRALLREAAASHGVAPDAFDRLFDDEDVRASLAPQFARARSYGTQALPSVLVEAGGSTRLLAGGYASAEVLLDMLQTA